MCLDLHIPVYHNLNKIVIWCVFHIKKIQILKVAKRNKGDNLYIINKGDNLYIYISNKGDNYIIFASNYKEGRYL